MKRNATLFALCALLPLFAAAQSTIQSTQTVQVTHTATSTSQASATAPPAGYNGGNDNPENPTDAGASGSSQGAFSLSKGALAAIIVVVVVVVLGGAASATLFYLAKKRQWDVRQSFRRASRRITGRSTADLDRAKASSRSQNRRTGVRIASPPLSARALVAKRGEMNRDVEKGVPVEKPTTTTTITSTFEVETPKTKGWKAYFGGK